MKRQREDPSITPLPSEATKVATKRAAKRAKANQACTSCRKNKTRCELLESTIYDSRCHRCDVLSITCSFETNAPPIQPADDTPHTLDRRRLLNTIFTPQSLADRPQCGAPGSNPLSTSPWEFLNVPGIPDWTGTPMLAMLTLSKMACEVQPPMQQIPNLTFTDVLTADQRHSLLSLFESHYAPWLSLPPNTLAEEDPVLDLIRCTVASRHLEASIRMSVFPTLRRLTEEAIMKHIFNPTPSPAIIQAFALLALWSPFDTSSPSSSSETHDSRLIAAAAVNMCSSLRFDQAATHHEQVLEGRCKSGAENASQEAALLTTAEQKKFIWMCIHNVESMVCTGTGRGISSKSIGCKLRSLSPLNFSTLSDARRTRMLLSAMIFDLTETGLRLELSEDHGKFEEFCNELAEVLWRFDGLQRVISSVHVVTDIEVFYTHMLIVNFYFCRLTFLLHTLRHMHPHMTQSVIARGSCLFTGKVKRSGTGLALACSRDALASSEALLTTILSIKDRELLATAPDSVFGMISFAAAWVTTARFLMLQSKAMRSIPGSSGELITRTIKCLQQVALSTDDNASRCARVISGFVDTWEKMERAQDAEAAPVTPGERNDTPQTASSLSSAAKTTHHGYTNSQSTMTGPSPETTSSPSELDYMLNFDQLLGLDFWQYLAELPNIQPDINATYNSHP